MFAASGCRDDLDALLMRRAQSAQRALSDGAVVAQQRIIHIKGNRLNHVHSPFRALSRHYTKNPRIPP